MFRSWLSPVERFRQALRFYRLHYVRAVNGLFRTRHIESIVLSVVDIEKRGLIDGQ